MGLVSDTGRYIVTRITIENGCPLSLGLIPKLYCSCGLSIMLGQTAPSKSYITLIRMNSDTCIIFVENRRLFMQLLSTSRQITLVTIFYMIPFNNKIWHNGLLAKLYLLNLYQGSVLKALLWWFISTIIKL